MEIISEKIKLQKTLEKYEGKTIALVPTMGNLHDGHISLIKLAKQHADLVIVSIFVNKLQFGKNEDFDRYPRTIEADCIKVQKTHIDIIYTPKESDIYPESQITRISADPILSNILEGKTRPDFFSGVCTVVNKLIQITKPDFLLLGKKDFQQVCVLKEMISRFNLPIRIIEGEVIRDNDGLALSSRNQYLSPEERTKASILYQTIKNIKDKILIGKRNFTDLEKQGIIYLKNAGLYADYISIRDAHSLQLASEKSNNLIILAAAWLGTTRLIDNVECRANPNQ